MRSTRNTPVFVVMFILLMALTAVPASAQESGGTFEPTECNFAIPEGAEVECGYVVVPEDRSGDPADTIRLYTAIYRTISASPREPLVFLQGGPGGAIVDALVANYDNFIAPITETRDFIVFDQRGTGGSLPALNCTEVTEFTIENLERILTVEEATAGTIEALTACRQRLEAEGVNIPAYTSAENAADVADIAATLGYEQVSLFGGSYGTRLALTVARDFPELVASMVLDGVLPPDINLYNQQAFKTDYALNVLFENCAADEECSAAYPTLEEDFYALVEQLNENPITVTITSPTDGHSYDVPVDGTGFIAAFFFSLQISGLIPNAPELVYAVQAGDTSGLVLPLTIPLLIGDTVNIGMFYSVNCPEEAYATTPEDLVADQEAYPNVAAFGLQAVLNGEGTIAVCEAWGAAEFDPREVEPVVSDIPTLLFAGEYDPATPIVWAELAAESLSNSYVYELPGLGHVESPTQACPTSIILDFLADPTTEPDASCIAEMPTTDFLIGGETVEAPPVTLVEFASDQFGITGLIPEGWTEAGPGVYARGSSATDTTALIIQAAPGASADILSGLLPALGIAETPESTGTREANGLTWTLYEVEVQGIPVRIALADADGLAIIALIQGAAAEIDSLVETVFYPVIDSLVPAQ
ncbi:MAG: alpha/beta fold hydrolase [bacterium]|nr:alpha/beta fold hydrolase [bacterium]